MLNPIFICLSEQIEIAESSGLSFKLIENINEAIEWLNIKLA